MRVKHLLGPATLAVSMLFGSAVTAAPSEPAPIVTGKHWTESDANLKKAYLLGMANVLEVERAYQQRRAVPDSQTLVPKFSMGLQNQTLDSVRDTLDRWYAANPGQLDRPVVETIWFEIVMPATKTKRTP
ncbi:hypothetical protein [Achromobacter sp. MFA1 R4]|uniref:hypothetical protein n=1 Tax=Achromobacter sp. MFA1 R4 TaxID=1881016 RepID=UPI000953939F|nr:hypothetical protein [Achromobacter sp. MFA1 R4]SIT30718.1 hypothetical protein SAMN05428937_4731 [Achromobacter sp. MFA1 R4]